MWTILESTNARKALKRVPVDILKRYEKWKDIVRISGPTGLKRIKGFHDEALHGDWQSYRSSRLNIQYRVIYKSLKDEVIIEVVEVTAHDYRRKS
jgi:addiction module RelE/StbE family toxin